MGGLFKKKSSSTTTKENSTQKNLLADNKDFMNVWNQANRELQTAPLQQQLLAEYSQQFKDAESNLLKGVDLSDYKQAQQYMQGMGQSQLDKGLGLQESAQGMLSRIAGMTTEDYHKAFESEFNSDLVNQQIAEATKDINEQTAQDIYGLNQNASLSGNMGSSRTGVTQGVIQGKALRAIGSASVQYRTAEESAAQQRVMSYLGMQQSSASSLANLAQSQISTGYNAYNQGMSYLNQYNQNYLQNQQNAYNVGLQQQQRQQQMLQAAQYNSWLGSSPALARLQQYGGILSPFANSQTTGNKTTTTVAPAQGNGMMGGLMGAAGAVAGGFFGGPMGASLGASLGGSIGQSM
ncbi:hypothetical protein GHH61_23600 [Salmonella enterica]|nr:hypothetical protein [Salmonella enterica]